MPTPCGTDWFAQEKDQEKILEPLLAVLVMVS